MASESGPGRSRPALRSPTAMHDRFLVATLRDPVALRRRLALALALGVPVARGEHSILARRWRRPRG